MKDLDRRAAEVAQAIIADTKTYMHKNKDGKAEKKDIDAGEVDNLITKTLGVLQENGVYAATLYLYSRTTDADKAIATKTREALLSLTSELVSSKPTSMKASDALKFLTDEISNDLDGLLLVKQLWEQTLIYTRYGAKARGVEDEMMKEEEARKEAEKAKSQP